MCGIFCSISRNHFIHPHTSTRQLLHNRGPDSSAQHLVTTGTEHSAQYYVTFDSTVLSLRGQTLVQQPLRDAPTGSVLCWNGEAWSIGDEMVTGNDSQLVFERLLSAQSSKDSMRVVIALLESIRGPYALVFYDAPHKLLYYGRDCLGRRSLLLKSAQDDSIVLSSVCANACGESWAEVEADGIYLLDLSHPTRNKSLPSAKVVPHRRRVETGTDDEPFCFNLPFPLMNRTLDKSAAPAEVISQLRHSLQTSLELRTQHVRESVPHEADGADPRAPRVAILFSGGLDCTILARMCNDLLPLDEPIDLLNVAFENPRIHGKLDPGITPYELCPDRITGRASYAELVDVCPGRRWQLVEVDVPYSETTAHCANVMTLMHPHNTEMDLSISYALYFASRGSGKLYQAETSSSSSSSSSSSTYTTPARVLLSGLGADELFGGYQRHATAFSRQGYDGLLDELELDFTRLGKRNLGRDDRVISNSGREVRFPYLDEAFITAALNLPVTAKCDFGTPQDPNSDDPATFLEPGKRALRLLAWHLGMEKVAAEKKRAIQFGARTAKMQTGRTKGTQVLC